MIYTLGVASLAIWLALASRATERPLLRYEPRRPVPWGGVGAVLAVFFVALPIVEPLLAGSEPPPLDPVWRIAGGITQQTLFTGIVAAAIAVSYGATARDLGLPRGGREWGWSVVIGLVAWLASLLPVQGTQALLSSWLHTTSQHPLVQLVIEDRSPALLAVALVAAVVVAPICEEIIFRLLLQGWLEKLEDAVLGWRKSTPASDSTPAVASSDWGGRVSRDMDGSIEPVPVAPGPPRRGMAGLPYGWAPILLSSQLWGLAHWGHGTDPIPLVLLGFILGYTYQRTHKVVPCIVAHMAFNLLSMFVLWRAIETGAM